MYVGHFAIGMALKAREPKLPSLPIFLGVCVLDLIDGLFVVLGIDRVTPNLASGPYLFFDLTYIDWDHSLLMAAVWSLAWGALFLRDRRVAAVAAFAAFSHFLADWPMHNGDLALYPNAATHLGAGLWHAMGDWSWALEGAFSVALCAYAWRAWAARGVSMAWPCALLGALFLNVSPWLSPMRFVATLPEPWADKLTGALVAISFGVPAVLLGWLVDRAAKARSAAA